MYYNSKAVRDTARTVLHIQDGAWLSLVERCVRDAEVAGSNPVAPILKPHRLYQVCGVSYVYVRILGFFFDDTAVAFGNDHAGVFDEFVERDRSAVL